MAKKRAAADAASHGSSANVGIEAKLWVSADTFLRDAHPDLKGNIVLANPPSNGSDYSGPLLRGDKGWTFGGPPVGNANYAWFRYPIHHLAYPNNCGDVVVELRRDEEFRGPL